jgi:hypothetical protein
MVTTAHKKKENAHAKKSEKNPRGVSSEKTPEREPHGEPVRKWQFRYACIWG